MRILSMLRSGCSPSVELLKGLWNGPYWWLVPVVVLLLPAALLFIFLNTVPVVAPFVYTVL
jgi:hypothetical protein